MINLRVSKFNNYRSKNSNEIVNLWSWLLKENEYYTHVVTQIRSTSDEEEKRKLKSMLPAITPSGIFYERNANLVKEYSGIICIDIDGKENPHLSNWDEVKTILSKFPYIMYCGLSVSGNGLFCMIHLDDPLKHKEHFNALYDDFNRQSINIDKSCSDICRLRGYSIDTKPIFNLNSEIYKKQLPTNTFNKNELVQMISPTANVTPNFSIRRSPEEILLNPTIYTGSAVITSLTDKIKNLVEKISSISIDITTDCSDWFVICCIIANRYGEDGRTQFHTISQFYPRYTKKECDDLFTKCLKKPYHYKASRLFEIAQQYGI